MKSFQVRLSDEVYDMLRSIAEDRDASLADVIRESLEVYALGILYAKEGKRLVWESNDGTKAELLIPSLTIRQQIKDAMATK